MSPNLDSILRDHVSLSVSCIDRIYLNGYMPKLQTAGQLCTFLRDHLGYPIPSPGLFHPMHDHFVDGIRAFAMERNVPVVKFERGQRKDDIASGYRSTFEQSEGVVFIGVAQEKALSFKAHKANRPGAGLFDFSRQSVWVNHYYFYYYFYCSVSNASLALPTFSMMASTDAVQVKGRGS